MSTTPALLYTLNGRVPVECRDTLAWAMAMTELGEKGRTVARYDDAFCVISTIFIGCRLDPIGDVPRVFETCVFGGPLHLETERYATWNEAEQGHAQMVAKLREMWP
jgi:hypothetical protein